MNAVRALVPPVGRHAAHDLDRGLMIAVRRVMVIPGRVDLDSVVGGNARKGLDLHLRRTATGNEDIDQLLARPSFDVNAVEVAAHDLFRDTGRQQKGTTAFASNLQ